MRTGRREDGDGLLRNHEKGPIRCRAMAGYFLAAQQVWQSANNREEAVRFLEKLPEPKPENFEKLLAFMRTLPYFLRAQLQAAAKDLPPSPGGRPRGLTPNQSREVCQQIGQLYGNGVDLANAKRRIALRYGVSLSTIQRAWKERGAWSRSSI